MIDAGMRAGTIPTGAVLSTYQNHKTTAMNQQAKAVSQAQTIFTKIQGAWQQFSQQGVPTIKDYISAPAVATVEAAQKAAQAIEKAAPGIVGQAGNIIKYGAIAAVGLGILYVYSFLPRPRRS